MLTFLKKNIWNVILILVTSLFFALFFHRPDGTQLAVLIFVMFWYAQMVQKALLDDELNQTFKILFTVLSGVVGQTIVYSVFGISRQFWITLLFLPLAIIALPIRERIQGYFEKKEKSSFT